VRLTAPSAASPVISEQAGQPNALASSPSAEGFGQAPLSGQHYEQTQPAATMVTPPFGAAAAPSAELFSSDHREHSASTIRRGEVLVLLGALLLFIASFLPFYDSSYGVSTNAWAWFFLPLLVLGFGSGVLAGLFIALDRLTTVGDVAGRIGLSLNQLVGVLAVVSAVDLTLSVISAPLHGAGQWLGLAAAALILVGSVFAKHVPALMLPVGTSAPAVHGAAPAAQAATAWAPATAAPAPAPAPAPTISTTSSVSPRRTTPPSGITVGPSRRLPLNHVPLSEPRSSISIPAGVARTAMWRRDSSASSMTQSTSPRPTTTSPSTSKRVPAPGPLWTISVGMPGGSGAMTWPQA
jgi:hypothetical protein